MIAFSYTAPDSSRKGSICITMQQGDKIVAGGNFNLYQVGKVDEKDGDYSFVLTGAFTDCGESLENIQSQQLANNLAKYAADHDVKGNEQIVSPNGKVTFDNLDLGLYLLVQTKATNGYEKVSPFLVSVPTTENGSYIYDVDVSPKIELEQKTHPSTPQPTKPESKLPQSGQLNWPIPILVVLGLSVFSVGWVLYFKKEEHRNEK